MTLGLLAVSLLRLASPARLALVGTRADRLELGRRLGADELCDVTAGDAVESVGDGFRPKFVTNGTAAEE